MLLPLFALIFLAGWSSASPLANQYVDNVLSYALRNEIRLLSLDPASLPDFVTEFTDKVKVIGKVKGKAEYEHGNLTGLTGARRFSECQGPYFSFGMKTINCSITFDLLEMIYSGKLKYGKMPKVNIKAKANVTNTVLFIEISQAPNLPAHLKNYTFQQLGLVNTDISGLGPLNRFLKFLKDGLKSQCEAQLVNSISQRYQNAIGRAVNTVPLP